MKGENTRKIDIGVINPQGWPLYDRCWRLFQKILESEPLSGNTWRAASKQSRALEQMLGLILSHPVRRTIVLYYFVVNMTVLSV